MAHLDGDVAVRDGWGRNPSGEGQVMGKAQREGE